MEPKDIDQEELDELAGKKEFIRQLSEPIATFIPQVAGLEFEAFIPKGRDYIQEYLIVHFRGGAIAARTCNINSNLGNLIEVATLVRGGHYDEVDTYRRLKENSIKIV